MIQLTSKSYFRQLNVLFFAFVAGQLLLAAVFFFLIKNQEAGPDSSSVNVFMIVVSILLFNAFIVSHFLYKRQVERLKKYDTLVQKMTGYRSVLIIRLAIVETATIVSLIAFYLTGEQVFLGTAGIALAYFLFLKPVKEKIGRDLELNADEQRKIGNPEEIIAISGHQ